MKKIGIVTGASSGIGREFVRQLDNCLKHVDEVWVIARRKERLEALQEEMKHLSLRVLPLDLCKDEDLDFLKSQLELEQPSVKLLINCAGVGYSGAFASLTNEKIRNMMMLNMHALVAVTHMVLPYMAAPSNMIQLASASAFLPQKDFALYAASKAFVLSFSKALRQEVRERGIRVTTVCPGPVDTEFLNICNEGHKEKLLKKLTKVQAFDIVHKALRDAKAGKALSVYGLPMKAFRVLSKILH